MSITTGNLYNIKRLNVIFAAVSILLVVVVLWMLWHDYDRPWRQTQSDYFNLRSAMAHFDVLAYETEAKQREFHLLEAALKEAEAELAAPETKAALDKALQQERDIGGRLQGATLAFANLNVQLQVLAAEYEEAKMMHDEDHAHPAAARAAREASLAEVAEAKKRQDDLEDASREIKADVNRFYRLRDQAAKALALFVKGKSDALARDRMYGFGPERLLFNFPGLDFAAPKGVAGRQEVRQVFMPSVRFNFNFVDSYMTDRCITCHVGIDDPELTVASFAAKAEASLTSPTVTKVLRKENTRLREELSRRLGRVDDAPTPAQLAGFSSEQDNDARPRGARDHRGLIHELVDAANVYLDEIDRPPLDRRAVEESLSDGGELTRDRILEEITTRFMRVLTAARPQDADSDQPLTWQHMDARQQDSHFKALLAAMNTYLEHEGRPAVTFGKVLHAHPDLALYVSADSPHPIKRMGCTVCHEGSGQETDFVLAAHTPKSPEEEEAWEKYYVRELGLPLATFHLVEEYWERPMLLPDYTSASCRKCHDRAYDLQRHETAPLPTASRMVRGRDLYTAVGCINCHNVEGLSDSRRVGTDLAHVAEKLSTGFMQRWIEYPNAFRPSTRMPHYFKQENNLDGSRNAFDTQPELRTETEIQAITHYLRTFSTPYAPLPLPDGIEGDVPRGEELFVAVGCLACHANLDAKDPTDEQGRAFGERWLVEDLVYEEGLSPEAAANRYANEWSDNDRAREAMRRFTPERREAALQEKRTLGLEAAKRGEDPPEGFYVPPIFTRFAPELSGIGTKLVDDPTDPVQVVRGRTWLYNWLHEPRHYHSYAMMPRLFRDNHYWRSPVGERRPKTDQDVMDVVAYLLTLRNDDFDRTPISDDALHAQMRRELILTLLRGQNTESVSQRILDDDVFDAASPYGELTSGIVNQMYRAFGDGDDGKANVAAVIASRSPSLEDRRKLFLGMKMIGYYGCHSCHAIVGFEDASRPGTDMSLWAQKFLSQLDFAFYSPVFEEELARQPEVYGDLYVDAPEQAHLIRDADGNIPQRIVHNHGAFAYHKLRNPRIWDRGKIKKPYEKLKMPNFFFDEEEARSLVTFLLSRREPNVTEDLRIAYDTTAAGQVTAGRELVRKLNCIGCHVIEGNDAVVRQYYLDDPATDDANPFGPRFLPPLLWGEGAKIQYDWLFSFFRNVRVLRPWLNVRMPGFYLSVEETTTLVDYFAGLSRRESDLLEKHLRPVLKHIARARASGESPGSSPDDAWFLNEALRPHTDFLEYYALTHNQVRPFDFDASGATSQAEVVDILAPTYDKILSRAGFLANLFDVAYPFTDAGTNGLEDERFTLGESLFFNQRCLACHVAGDPFAEGTTAIVKAPNFSLTYERLRREWVVNWLQDPQAIQPGANMPQIFQGGSMFASLPPKKRQALEAEFGESPEKQVSLLVDFLFELGARRHTAVQPGVVGGAVEEAEPEGDLESDEFDEEFEDEFDE